MQCASSLATQLQQQACWSNVHLYAADGSGHALSVLQSTKLKEQERTNKTLQKEKEQLQAEVRDLKARIKEGEWHVTQSCCATPVVVLCSPASMSSCCCCTVVSDVVVG
jgi:anti-sigma28 factor (negative regulator of flagellin synthesis)